ncbi:MAG: YybS family protein [Firmicutes bacterium]|nr:YybS family protein [Bacillota bacterium]
MSNGDLLKPQRPDLGGNVRALAEGAMLTALTLILAIISLYVPVLNIIAQFLFPAPLALLVLRHGFKFGLLSSICIFLLSAILLGLPHAVYLFILYGFLGLFFGWCFRSGKKAVFALLGGVLISCASIILLLLFPKYVLGLSADSMQETLTTMFRSFALMAEQQGSSTMLGGMTVDEYVEYAFKFLPSVLLLVAMLLSFACYTLMGRLLRRLGHDIPKLPPFREWRIDWRLLWLLIAALMLTSLGQRLQYDLLEQIASNLLSALSIIFLVYGLSILIWVFWCFKAAIYIRVVVILFALLIFSGIIVIIVGVLDPLFDFRRRLEKYVKK